MTPKIIKVEYTKTYANEENAIKAVNRLYGTCSELRYLINPVIVNGKIRYGILFIGQSAVEAGVHFHFNIV